MKRLEFIAVALFVLGLSACKASSGELCQQDNDCQSGRCCGGPVADTDGRGRCVAADAPMCMPLQIITPRADSGPAPDSGPIDAGPIDAGNDAGADAGASMDAGRDAGSMADAGTDAGAVDAGVDAGGADAGRDAGGSDSGV